MSEKMLEATFFPYAVSDTTLITVIIPALEWNYSALVYAFYWLGTNIPI